jgi:hypothetical protein
MYKYQKGFAPIVIALIVLILAGVGGTSYYLITKQSPKQTVCTTEAKLCPDGSSVRRTGSSCEFAVCPEIETNEKEPQKITFNINNFQINLNTKIEYLNYYQSCREKESKLVATVDGKKIYKYGNSYLVKNELNGLCNFYYRNLDFFGNLDDKEKILEIIFNDGAENNQYYLSKVSNYTSSPETISINNINDLQEIAKNKKGESIYAIINPNNQILNYYYKNYLTWHRISVSDLSINNFIKLRPLLLWRDYDDSYIVFKNYNYGLFE